MMNSSLSTPFFATSSLDTSGQYELRTATIQDAEALVDIEDVANNEQNNPIMQLLWPKPKKTDGQQFQTTSGQLASDHVREEVLLVQKRMSNSENKYVKIVDGTGKLVAYGLWMFVPGKSSAEWKELWNTRYRPPGINVALCDATSGARLLKRPAILGNQDYATLQELYVHPDHQRQGLGSMIVRWGIHHADTQQLPVYIESTEKGRGLYCRFGLQEVDQVAVNLEPWGGRPGEWHRYSLLYKSPVR